MILLTKSVLRRQEIQIPAPGQRLNAFLVIPENAIGMVVFAHGSGSGRLSPRNQYVADILNQSGIATLLVDLLSDRESRDRNLIFDIDLLAERLDACATWLAENPQTEKLPLGYFGASTGAAAAILATTRGDFQPRAIVSRGGRPDLAMDELPDIHCPTLFLVGALDTEVLELNRRAFNLLECTKDLKVVPHATHLFPEPGALEAVAHLACAWFVKHLKSVPVRE